MVRILMASFFYGKDLNGKVLYGKVLYCKVFNGKVLYGICRHDSLLHA